MSNFRVQSQITGLRGDVVFIGLAIAGALVLNAYILIQIANELHALRKTQQPKDQLPFNENEIITATDKVAEEKPVKEQTVKEEPVKETKTESETKTENEKQ
ncbi:MAG: hypothetical protein WAQ28_05795 [Bacteroidia bacterium]|jgi:hypothetical protein